MEDDIKVNEANIEEIADSIGDVFEGQTTTSIQMAFDVVMSLALYQMEQLQVLRPNLTTEEIKAEIHVAIATAANTYLEGGYEIELNEPEEEKPHFTDNVIQLH